MSSFGEESCNYSLAWNLYTSISQYLSLISSHLLFVRQQLTGTFRIMPQKIIISFILNQHLSIDFVQVSAHLVHFTNCAHIFWFIMCMLLICLLNILQMLILLIRTAYYFALSHILFMCLSLSNSSWVLNTTSMCLKLILALVLYLCELFIKWMKSEKGN